MLGVAMAWRQGQSYSEDLRARVLAAIDGGMAARAAASVFRVSVSYIYKALIRRRRTGAVSASSRRGHRPRKLTPAQKAALASHITPTRTSPWRHYRPGYLPSTGSGRQLGNQRPDATRAVLATRKAHRPRRTHTSSPVLAD